MTTATDFSLMSLRVYATSRSNDPNLLTRDSELNRPRVPDGWTEDWRPDNETGFSVGIYRNTSTGKRGQVLPFAHATTHLPDLRSLSTATSMHKTREAPEGASLVLDDSPQAACSKVTQPLDVFLTRLAACSKATAKLA